MVNSSQINFLPLNVPLHLFVDSARNDVVAVAPIRSEYLESRFDL
ncbi:hypothetical protein BH18ACI4_BH18ACI4_19850 [soil metagenome]